MDDSKEIRKYEKTIEEKNVLIEKLRDSVALFSRQADDAQVARIFAEYIFNTVHEPVLIIDGEFKVITANVSFYRDFAVTEQDIAKKSLFSMADNKLDIPGLRNLLNEILPGSGRIHNFQVEIELAGIGLRKFLLNATKVPQTDDTREFILLAFNDVTEQSRMDEQKDTLMREMHHRIKNNLAVIQALLRLQSKDIDDEIAREYFDETHARVQSISLIHEMLYQSRDLSNINFLEYIGKLIKSLVRYNKENSMVSISLNIESITLDLDSMLPLGLIVTELVTNAFKYAFPDGRSGHITIGLSSKDNDHHVLSVKDDGVGIPQDFDINKADSFGMKIISSLVKQIRGGLEILRDGGSEFRISFRNLKPSDLAEKSGS